MLHSTCPALVLTSIELLRSINRRVIFAAVGDGIWESFS